MPSNIIFSSEVFTLEAKSDEAWEAWCKQGSLNFPKGSERKCFRSEENPCHFLELISISAFSEVESLLRDREPFVTDMTPFLASDFRQQAFKHVETVKPGSEALPSTKKLQMRYVEVPLSVKEGYLAWREKTIFDVVRNADQIQSFDAYHTLLSNQPGVMFFSGFEGDSEEYMNNIFLTPRYAEIAKEAGDNFVVGGVSGLYTRIFIAE